MPRKPLDSEHETVTCTVRLRLGTRIRIDEERGSTPRSEYLRDLIERSLGEDRPLPPEPKPRPKILPAKKHLHRFKRVGAPVGYSKGIAIHRYECECGSTKEE